MAWDIGASAHGAPPSGGPRGEICQAAYAQSEITLGLTVSATQGEGGGGKWISCNVCRKLGEARHVLFVV